MRSVLLAMLAGCGFQPSTAITPQSDSARPIPDAMADAKVEIDPCGGTLLCFDFDVDPLPTTLPNGGSATVSASLTGIMRGTGVTGAALLSTVNSEIFVPSVAQLTNVLALDFWVRVDQFPPSGSRIGLIDTAVVGGFNSFYYNFSPPELRCTIAGFDYYVTVAPFAGWTHIACSCDAPTLSVYVNGVLADSADQACTGAITAPPYGIQIGADNVDGAANTDDVLNGAVDDVRLYNAPLTAQQVCKLAGTC